MTAKKNTQSQQSQGDQERVQQLLAERQAIARALHSFVSRAQAEEALAPVFTADEGTQMLLLKQLVHQRDADAADMLLAINELAPAKTVRKEARRALIQLAGAKIYPSWTPEPETPAVGLIPADNPPRFWKGSVSEMRETGEIQLTLCWEQGIDYTDVRLISFLLDFWENGVKDFFTEIGSRHHIEEHLNELQQETQILTKGYEGDTEDTEMPVRYLDCTLAEGRRLLTQALDVNRWRKTEPHKDFRQHVSLVQRLILHAMDESVDQGQTFIAHGLAPDMVVASFVGAWSMGDFGLAYDFLTRNNALQERLTCDEWAERRRAWADEAHPARFEMYFLHELEQKQQSSLWLPTSILSQRASQQKEIEISWSLELTDTQLSGTLPEMPMGTAVYKETGRHWFWHIFTLTQEDGEWRIASIKDEGLALQGLPLEELHKRIKEHDETIQKIMREHRPDELDAQQYMDEIIRNTFQILSLDDAVLAKNPLDKALYEEAFGRAMSMRATERAAIYIEELVKRFPQDPDHLPHQQQLGAVQIAISDRFSQIHVTERAQYFESLGEATLRGALNENDPLGHILLAELLVGREKYDEAEQELLKARELAQENDIKAQVEYDLANLELERENFPQAQQYLEHIAEITPNYPSLWATLGFVHRSQGNYPEAEVYYKRAVEEDPTDVRVYSELGAIYISQEELDKARDIVAQGIRALPQSAHLKALMATIYLQKKDQRRAREYLEDAERINPNLEIVQAVRELVKTK